MKILIVDDSELLRDRLRNSINTIKGAEIIGEATSGAEALQLVSEQDPDLVILDIRMPEMSGIEVLGKIKEAGSKAIICVLTNYPYLQYKQKCMEGGADYFFDKNQDFKEVINLLEMISKKII